MIDINSLINNPLLFSNIKESDIDEISLKIQPFFKDKIALTADFIVSKLTQNNKNSKEVFQYQLEEKLRPIVHSYVANGKWKINIPIIKYINKAIRLITQKILHEYSGNESTKIRNYICPICKEYGLNEILIKDGNLLYCKFCDDKSVDDSFSDEQLFIFDIFKKHSISGVCCPECSKFVPISAGTCKLLRCPFCFANCDGAKKIKHPEKILYRKIYSINNYKSNKEYNNDTVNNICDNSENSSLELIEKQELENNIAIIKEVINLQKNCHSYIRKTPNRAAMYEAFNNVLLKYPEDMSNYIISGGPNNQLPIQAIIYQEFAKIMKQKIPITLVSSGETIVIDNYFHKKLYLFCGMKQFSNFIDSNSNVKVRKGYDILNNKIIDNNTYFMAELISITDTMGNDLSEFVEYYTFTSIKLKYDKKLTNPGIDVIVKYYAILPSYTLGSAFYMQRVKKKISTSVKRKLHG